MFSRRISFMRAVPLLIASVGVLAHAQQPQTFHSTELPFEDWKRAAQCSGEKGRSLLNFPKESQVKPHCEQGKEIIIGTIEFPPGTTNFVTTDWHPPKLGVVTVSLQWLAEAEKGVVRWSASGMCGDRPWGEPTAVIAPLTPPSKGLRRTDLTLLRTQLNGCSDGDDLIIKITRDGKAEKKEENPAATGARLLGVGVRVTK
jgi:hypothetical protein